MSLSILKRANIRVRLAVLCAFLIAPLCVLVLVQAQRTYDDFTVLQRQIGEAAALRALAPEITKGGDAKALTQRVTDASAMLVLDPHAATYHLADALDSDLLVLALGAGDGDSARLAQRSAESLFDAAAGLRRGGRRNSLAARAARLNALAGEPADKASGEAARLWGDTAKDLHELLVKRRAAMIRHIVLGVLLGGGSVAIGCWLAAAVARNLTRRVTLLVGQIERLTNNDTSGQTPFLDDPHDMGRIAKGVDALRLSLIDARDAWSQVLVNEMRCALLADHTKAIVLRTDPDGTVVFTSPASQDLDFDPDEIEGTSAWDLFEPGDREALSHATPKTHGEVIVRRRRRLARRFGAVELWDVEVGLPEEEAEGLVFVLKPAAG